MPVDHGRSAYTRSGTCALFRTEVGAARRQRLDGEVLLSVPIAHSVFVLALTLTLIVAATFITLGSARETVQVGGRLVVGGGGAELVAPRAGMVARIYASEGDHVDRGDPILLISDGRNDQDGVEVDRARVESMAREIAALELSKAARLRLTGLERTALDRRRDRSRDDATSIARELESVASRSEIAQRAHARAKGLIDDGALPREALDEVTSQVLSLDAVLESLHRQYAATAEAIEAESDRERVIEDRTAIEIATLDARLERLRRDVHEVDLRLGSELQAPRSGRVTRLEVRTGHHVQGGDRLGFVIADDTTIEAELDVPTRAARMVEAGRTARIRLHAFPYARFGSFEAVIHERSEVLVDGSTGAAATPFLRIRARLLTGPLEEAGIAGVLRDGMTLDASLRGEARPLWRWLVQTPAAISDRLRTTLTEPDP